MKTDDIAVGQRWRDKDSRECNRVLTVRAVEKRHAVMSPNDRFPKMMETRIRLDRLVRRWELQEGSAA